MFGLFGSKKKKEVKKEPVQPTVSLQDTCNRVRVSFFKF